MPRRGATIGSPAPASLPSSPSIRNRSSPTNCRSASCSGCCSGGASRRRASRTKTRSAASWCSRTSATGCCSRCSPTPRTARCWRSTRPPSPTSRACSARRRRGPQRAACFQIAFDFEKLSWELHFFWKHFLEGYRKRDLSRRGPRVARRRASTGSAAEIASWPRVLCHRDFHSRNLMLHAGALYWIDFQDARMGPATYDLASLLRDSYVDLDEEFVAERAEEFRQQRGARRGARHLPAALRPDVDPAQPEGAGHLRLHGDGARQAASTCPYIPRTLAHAARATWRATRSCPALRRALARHLEELA